MATLCTIASGLFDASTTYGACDATAELDSEAGTTTVGTSALTSSSFTPGAITIDGLAIKVSSRIVSAGAATFTITLRNTTDAVDTISVTVNLSDFRRAARGWYVFDIADTLLVAGKAYAIKCVCSVASGLVLFRNATTDNFSRQLRTTTQAAPASGDKIIMAGQKTGAGTRNDYTITYNGTASTSFGPTVSGGPPQGITINDGATLQLQNTPATNYVLKWKGVFAVYAGSQLLLDGGPTATTGNVSAITARSAVGRVCNASNASPISILAGAPHGLSTGDILRIMGVGQNTNANGYQTVTVVDTLNFTLDGTTGNGDLDFPYLPNGVWYTPVVVTSNSHGLTTGDMITLTGVVGAEGCNGAWEVYVLTVNKFILVGCSNASTYTSGGTWVKRAQLDATSSFEGIMDSVANVDTGLEIMDGLCCMYGATKLPYTKVAESTVIGSDTNSVGSLVTTSGAVVTWVEGQKFDTGWTGTVNIGAVGGSGMTSYTISGTPTATSMTMTATITTGASVSHRASELVKTGTGAPTVLKVDSTSGWLAGDQIVVGSSTNRQEDSEVLTIQTVDSATQVTFTAAMTRYHSGLNDASGDVRATVINLTRNIKFHGISTVLQGYVTITQSTTQVDIGTIAAKYAEFYQLGSATTQKRGITSANNGTANAHGFNLQYCSIHDFGGVASAVGIAFFSGISSPTPVNGAVIGYCVFWGTLAATNICITDLSSGITGNFTIHDNVAISPSITGTLYSIGAPRGILDNNVAVGGSTGFSWSNFSGTQSIGAITRNKGRACVTPFNYAVSGTCGVIGDGTQEQCFTRNGGTGLSGNVSFAPITSVGRLAVNCMKIVSAGVSGAATGCVSFSGSGPIELHNFYLSAGANIFGFIGVGMSGGAPELVFTNLEYDQVNLFTSGSGDVALGSSHVIAKAIFHNTKWGLPNAWVGSNPSIYGAQNAYMVSLKHQQVAGAMSMYKGGEGGPSSSPPLMKIDLVTDIVNAGSFSLKMIPAIFGSNANGHRFRSIAFEVPVASGSTVSPSVYVRKSVIGDGTAYNGSQPKLILLKDYHIGITKEAVLDTGAAAAGSWEELTGTTPTFTGKGVARFVIEVECSLSSPAGWINIADFVCPGQTTKFMDYWGEDFAGPAVIGDHSPAHAKHMLGI